MKTKKICIVLLVLGVLLDSNTVLAYNKGVDKDIMAAGGYVESDLDTNAPIYDSDFAPYSDEVVPTFFPENKINGIESAYPSVRNQNPYGTCWAFSSIGLAEFDLINDGLEDKSVDFSELQLAYFTYNSVQDPLGGTEGDSAVYHSNNTSTSFLNAGGNYAWATRRMSQWVGTVNESIVPYAKAESGELDSSYAYDYDVAHLQNAYRVNIKSQPDEVKKQIMEHGAVGVTYSHHYGGMQYITNSYYDDSSTWGNAGGHAVMIVGWDDDYSIDNFSKDAKPTSKGAWLVRNSWGSGDFDYFWMSYETASLNDTAWVLDFDENDGYDNNYQIDGGLETGVDKSYKNVANVFHVSKKDGVDYEILKAVSLSFLYTANVGYEINIYTDLADEMNPISGTKSATVSGRTGYAGYYTIPLDDEVKLTLGSTYSVVVSMDQAAMEFEEARSTKVDPSDSSSPYVWECKVSDNYNNDHTSFYDGHYGGVTRWNVSPWGNYRIKAFTSNVTNNIVTHSIKYNLDGGENNKDNPISYEENNMEIPLKNPVRTGYTFKGWYTDNNFNNLINVIPANSTQDYLLYAKWEKEIVIDDIANQNRNVLADGEYIMLSSLNSLYGIDVSGGALNDYANVQLYMINNTDAQAWNVKHDSKGYITFTNVKSGKALDLFNGKAENGSNVQQYSNGEGNSQKWIAIKNGDGTYTIVSALNENLCLDLNGGAIINGNNIQIYTKNGTNAQKWILRDTSKMDRLAATNRNTISGGEYTINSSINNNYVLDVSGGSKADRGNVNLYKENGTNAQVWKITHDSKGYMIITNINSGKVLEVQNGLQQNETNIWQNKLNNSKAQKWIAVKTSNGNVQIISALNENMRLDLKNAKVSNGANIQLYSNNGSMAQMWKFVKFDYLDYMAKTNRNVIVNGSYIIRSVINKNYVLDVSGGSMSNGGNVQLYENNMTLAQRWNVSHDEKGYLTILNVKSGKALDVHSAMAQNNSNIQQYDSNGTKAQKWIALRKTDGSIKLVSALNRNMCVDLTYALITNAQNIQLYEDNNSNAQGWYFDKK